MAPINVNLLSLSDSPLILDDVGVSNAKANQKIFCGSAVKNKAGVLPRLYCVTPRVAVEWILIPVGRFVADYLVKHSRFKSDS